MLWISCVFYFVLVQKEKSDMALRPTNTECGGRPHPQLASRFIWGGRWKWLNQVSAGLGEGQLDPTA